MDIRWNEEKNALLKHQRGVSFEEVASIIEAGEELDMLPHPVRSNQRILVVRIHGYAVPFIQTETGLFLKTIYPSRELQKQYGGA